MGFYIASETSDGFKVGAYGSQNYLTGALFAGYALAKCEGWQRVGARWVTVNDALPGTVPVDRLDRCQGNRLHQALRDWVFTSSADGSGSVLVGAPASVRLGRQFKPAAVGSPLADLLTFYDAINDADCNGYVDGATAARFAPFLAEAATQVAGMPGGWDVALTALAALATRGEPLRFG